LTSIQPIVSYQDQSEIATLVKPSLLDLFRPRMILLRSLNMFFQWFSVTMGYYGLLFASTALAGDPYQNFLLVILAELPSIFVYLVFVDRFGRKPILITTQITSGICCISGGLLVGVIQGDPSISVRGRNHF
jgi:OCT family organic cation transporter-like MFS transporter 4/5